MLGRSAEHVDGHEDHEGDDDGQQDDPVQVRDHNATEPPAGGSPASAPPRQLRLGVCGPAGLVILRSREFPDTPTVLSLRTKIREPHGVIASCLNIADGLIAAMCATGLLLVSCD